MSARWIRQNRASIDIINVNGAVTACESDVNAAHFVHGAWLKNPFYPFRKWWRTPYAAYQRYYSGLNADLELIEYRRSRTIAAVSNKVADELVSVGIAPEKITVISNGVDITEFCPGTSERSEFDLPSDVPLFLFAGDIRTPRKNLGTVLHSISNVGNLHLAVAGDCSRSPFPAIAKNLGISDRVYFLGNVKDMPKLMRSVDALVFPSRYDTAGLVIMEALASGIPVITSKTVGMWEVVGDAGRCLDNPDDVQTLTIWMREFAADELLRERMGAAGRAIALQHGWERMAAKYQALYLRLSEGNVGQANSLA
jgi:glycosyltransferase involved in cell wall biosynthesis